MEPLIESPSGQRAPETPTSAAQAGALRGSRAPSSWRDHGVLYDVCPMSPQLTGADPKSQGHFAANYSAAHLAIDWLVTLAGAGRTVGYFRRLGAWGPAGGGVFFVSGYSARTVPERACRWPANMCDPAGGGDRVQGEPGGVPAVLR